jgi:hypothetical protein
MRQLLGATNTRAVELCGRYPATDIGMGAWHGAAASKDLVGAWATSKVAAA